MKINKKFGKKKVFIISSAVVVAAVGLYVGAAFMYKLPPFAVAQKTYQPGEQFVNLERSDSEQKAEKSLKDNPERKTQNNQTDTPDSPSQNSAGKLEANVLVTNAGISNGTVSASGFVTNIVEEGGSCTYTFVSGSSKVTKVSETLTNPSSTTCSTVRFSESELPVDGTWKVSLSYSSNTASGKSAEKEFTK